MCKYCEKMDKAKALDFAIRDYKLKYKIIAPTDVHYIIEEENRDYWNYMSNKSWERFKENAMTKEHRNNYIDAKGGELDPRKSRWGMLPPKMASFGSSSRLIYNLSKDTPGFVFEKQMPTCVGHDANLDGYLLNDNTAIFVEAKCREIYASHSGLEISKKYEDLYKYLLVKKDSKFKYDRKDSKDPDYFKCTFQYDCQDIKYFDLKQLICHFLGITADLIKNKHAHNNIVFVYLIFNPEKNTDFSADAIMRYANGVKKQYKETIAEIAKFDGMKWLFDSIMRYQSENLQLPVANYTFVFKLMDQDEYKKYLIEISSQKLPRS